MKTTLAMTPISSLFALGLVLAAFGANAQTVYRCGNTYSQDPCPQAKVIDATDARTDAQRAAALQATADAKRLGREMEGDRLALQAAQKPAGAASLGGLPRKLVVSDVRQPKKPKKAKKPAASKAGKTAKAVV